jgi:hypothetical protein
VDVLLETIRKEPPVVRIGVQTAYLQRVGQVFKSMGLGYVEVIIRGPQVGVEFIGKNNGEVVATAVVMPVKL